MKLKKDETISLRMKKFKVGKHKMLLPDKDCLAMAMMYKGKLYGGFIGINFNDREQIDNIFNILVKCSKGTLYKLGALTNP